MFLRPSSHLRLARVVCGAVACALLSGCLPVRPVPKPTAAKLLFGMGPEATTNNRLVNEAPVHMLSSWYNGPADLSWMTAWKGTVVTDAYAAGRSLHLIVYTNDAEVAVATKYGPGCGRAYPLSARFLGDMAQLADTFAGAATGPAFYVTLFTEFQTYPCTDNAWDPNPQTNNYLRALKDQYMAALAVFHKHAPNARVSLGWGGWQSGWTDPSIGGGRAMIPYFADVMRASDFQSFQMMNSTTAPSDIRAMTSLLGPFGAVMLAHYQPSDAATLTSDMQTLFTDTSVADLVHQGLFAFSFMNNTGMDDPTAYQAAKTAVVTYASSS
jgi:hypothetical protein